MKHTHAHQTLIKITLERVSYYENKYCTPFSKQPPYFTYPLYLRKKYPPFCEIFENSTPFFMKGGFRKSKN